MLRSLFFFLAFGALPLSPAAVSAQEERSSWQAGTHALGEQTVASAESQIGPFEFDFFCLPDSGTPGNMILNLAADIDPGGRLALAQSRGALDARTLVRAGERVVGDVATQSAEEGRRVQMVFAPTAYDFGRLMTEEDLRLTFEDLAANSAFELTIPGRGLGPALCPIATACGHDLNGVCGIFTAVETAMTSAVPLTEPQTDAGDPQWFKSEFQPALAALPFHRTASIFDPASGSELHLSCLAEGGEALALNFMVNPDTQIAAPFNAESQAEVVWETLEAAGRWTGFDATEGGYGLERQGIPVTLINRATLEELMTTDQGIEVIARQGQSQISATFAPTGSRDAICAVMNGCGVPLGFSPACQNRQ